MLYFDRTDIPGGIDVNKTIPSKEFNVYHYQHFFRFQTAACNEYHDILFMSMDLDTTVILDIYGIDYRCIISGNSKSEAINL